MRTYRILPGHIQKQLPELNLSRQAFTRLNWIEWYFDHSKNAEQTCRHFNLSKSVFYRWLNRFDPYSLKKVDSRNSDKKPYQLRQMTTDPEVIKKIIKMRLENQKKSKYKIHLELLNQGLKVSHQVIQKVINRYVLSEVKLY